MKKIIFFFLMSSGLSFAEKKPEACIVSSVALEEMQQARTQIEEQKKALTQREQELQKKEQALLEQIKRLEELRALIHQDQQENEKKKEEKVAKLVETLLMMSPKAAAQILVNQEPALSIQIMSGIESARLGKILAAMDPVKASSLSQKMVSLKEKEGRK